MSQKYVAVDCGHFKDIFKKTGSKGVKYGSKTFDEYNDFNVHVSRELVDLLNYNNIKVLITQELSGDIQRSLQYRTDLANKEHVDLFVSIHANAGATSAHGACGFHWINSKGEKLVDIWRKHFANECPEVGLHGTGKHVSNYNSWTNFHVVRETKSVSCLFEHGFFTNASDREQLLNPTFRQKCANVLAQSICEYLGQTYKEKPKTITQKKTSQETTIYRVIVDGVQIGAYQHPEKAIVQHLAKHPKEIIIKKV